MNPRSLVLTRIHALNWYGYRESIPVEGNLLLAGVTGSGKSILMDLIQFVLIGDLRLVKFNQSATGDRSDRSLKGYVLGDTKQEEGGVTQYMREAAITYVALEFTWPGRKRAETWGFRVEFTGSGETQGRVTPFFIPAALGRGDFLDDQRRPLDYTAFKAMVESHTGPENVKGRLYAELSEYLAHMAQPAHLNFDRSVLRSLLPTAMSFTFLRSFNEFCRGFILSAERLDVRDVTDSYRAFKRYERDLIELDDQYQRLLAIRGHHARHGDLLRDVALARYLEGELRHRAATAELGQAEAKLAQLRETCKEEEARLAELDRLIPAAKNEVDQIKQAIGETPDGKLYLEIKRQNSQLVTEVNRLREIGKTVEDALQGRVRRAREWIATFAALPLEIRPELVGALEGALAALESAGIKGFPKASAALAEQAALAMAELARQIQPAQRRLAELRAALGQLREQIEALKGGRLPFPTRLLDALNRGLPAQNGEPAARHLRELCEIHEGEERWRPAVEVAFTRKFGVVVAAAQYDAAEKIYHQLREEARGESLVNPEKALKTRRAVRPGSLATKLATSHPVAEAILSHLFGDLVCVEKREELREHAAAITPDGFLARGAFVERPRLYDNLPFVGRRGLTQQLAFKEAERTRIEQEERAQRPLVERTEMLIAAGKALFERQESLTEEILQARLLPDKEEQLAGNIERLNQIDRARFDDLAQRQSALEAELKAFEGEIRALYQSEKRSALRFKEEEMVRLLKRETELSQKFAAIRDDTDISAWLPRLDDLRADMLARFPTEEQAADRFAQNAAQWTTEAGVTRAELLAARRELAMVHPKFEDLPCEAPDNDAYDKQLARLEESDIPEYRAKAERERKGWAHLFRTQVLEKLRHALAEVENTRLLLNGYLKNPVGNNRYRIIKWENPDFAIYHRLLEASALAHEDELFFASADASLRDAMNEFLTTLVEHPDSAEASRLLDYRYYFEYDMEVDDLGPDGDVRAVARVDRQSGKFSGGENQSPYFVAILASYLRAYKRHDRRSKLPSLALVPIDEAFSKLSGERIKDCITKLNGLGLQGVFSMSTGNIPYAFEHCDSLVVVSKEERRVGKRFQIRNIPVSLHKDSPEARRLLGIEE